MMAVSWLMARLSPGRRRFAHGEQLDQLGQHFVAIAAAQRQRQLRGEQAVAHADIVAAVGALEREILLASGEFGQSAAERLTRGARKSITVGVSTCMPKKQR